MKHVVLAPVLVLMWFLLAVHDVSSAELPRVLTWRVFDHANGDAIVGATVSVFFHEQGTPAQVAQTDAFGRVSIALPAEFVHWDIVEGEWLTHYMRIETAAAGYVRMQTVWASNDYYEASVAAREYMSLPRDPEDLTPVFSSIALRRAAPLEGKVVDKSGRPVANAKVAASVQKQVIYHSPVNTCWESYDNKPIESDVRTDKKGHWRYENVPPPISGEQIEVDVEHGDYFSQLHAYRRGSEPTDPDHQGIKPESYEKLQQGSTVIAMERSPGVAIRIRDSKRNIITNAEFCTDVYVRTRTEPCIQFDAKSKRHRITGIPCGTYTAMIYAPGFQPVMQTFTAKDRYPKIDVTLQPGASVQGRFVDQFGNPISNADLRLCPLSEDLRYSLKQQTDSNGKFELNGVPGKKVVVECYSSRHRRRSSQDTFSLTPRPEPYTLTCPVESSISGLVCDAVTSEPIRQYTYQLGDDGGPGAIYWAEPKTALQYVYGSENVCKGRNYVRVESDGYEPTTSPAIEVRSAHTVQNIYVKRRAEGLRARILDPDGKPVAGRMITCAFGSAAALQERIDHITKYKIEDGDFCEYSDSHGEMPVPDQIRGSDLLILAGSKGFAILHRQKKSVTQCTVRLTPFARIEGEAWLGGKPAAGVRVKFTPRTDLCFSDSFTYTDAKGHYALNCVSCPGRLTFDPDSPLDPNNPSTYLLRIVKTVEPKLGDRLRIDFPAGVTAKGKIILPADTGVNWRSTNRLIERSSGEPNAARSRQPVGLTEYAFRVGRDGSFYIPEVWPGEYELDVCFEKLRDDWRIASTTSVKNSLAIPGNAGDRPIDIGEICISPDSK